MSEFPLHGPLLRGTRKPRLALVGLPGTGKSSIFDAASSTEVRHGHLAGSSDTFRECAIEIGLEEASLVDLAPLDSLHDLSPASSSTFKYLLWGSRWPSVACHEPAQPTQDFAAPDVLIQVVDATTLERDLELSQELALLGRPMVIALNRVDEARHKGFYVNPHVLCEKLGVPVIPTVAHMGKGIAALFSAALKAAHDKSCPLPQAPSQHILDSLRTLNAALARPEIEHAFRVPRTLLLLQLACDCPYFRQEMAAHFPEAQAEIDAARRQADAGLPRPLADEIHADRHHRAALLFEAVTRRGNEAGQSAWQNALDELFLHPRWGLLGTLAIFALVLVVVFEVSSFIDGLTAQPLAAWVGEWTPQSTAGVVARAVADGLVGLTGIVFPYMLPLVMLLVALEESGIMHRVAFVVDRGFHRIGLHGGIAVPFLLGLGCNVPAISAAAASTSGRERIVASLLITFVPCSARSAILLALGGKYLGGAGVLALFFLPMLVIAIAGKLLTRRYPAAGPGLIQDIPAYALPRWRTLLATTWERTSDILTIVTPLLVAGSVLLALLAHFGADDFINLLLTPITVWWLGLPVALGVPILFGVLRKELSLLMIYAALGTQEIDQILSSGQIATFLAFLSFYVPCLSTFAVMQKLLGRREAWFSVSLSVGAALIIADLVRLGMALLDMLGLLA